MLDLRKNLSANVLDSLIFDLARDLYFDEVALKKSIYGIWRQLEDNILTQNALFFNYRYSLYTIDIFKKLLIQHSIFQQAIPIENVRMCLAILFAYHAARRFEGTIPEKNFSETSSTRFVHDAELIPNLQYRASVLLSSIQDHGYSISGKMVDEICNSIDPFEIQHSSYEDLAVLIRTSLVLGLFAFPGLEHNLPKIRQDFSNAFSNEKYASNTVKDLKQSLLENFWSQQYPSILVGINSLKGDRNNLIIKQMTHNLQKLGA